MQQALTFTISLYAGIHFILFSYFYFHLSVCIGRVRTVAIKIDQVHAEKKLALVCYRDCG